MRLNLLITLLFMGGLVFPQHPEIATLSFESSSHLPGLDTPQPLFHSSLLSDICSASSIPAPGHLPGFGESICPWAKAKPDMLSDPFNPASRYRIDPGLSSSLADEDADQFSFDQPKFRHASLHHEEVVREIIRFQRQSQWDFSGLISEFYMTRYGVAGF